MQRAKYPLSDRTEDRQLLLRLTQGSSGHLVLETAPILEGSKEALFKAMSPLIQQQMLRFSGKQCIDPWAQIVAYLNVQICVSVTPHL